MLRGVIRWVAALAVVVVAVVVVTAVAARIHTALAVSSAFEQRAVAAEALARSKQVEVDSLQHRVDSLGRVATTQAAALRARKHEVARVDSVSPPPKDCAPNLAARDSVIAAQDTLITTFASQAHAAQLAAASLQATVDTLTATLHDRPQPSLFVGKTLELGAFVGYCTTGKPCMGIGLTWNIGGIHL